MPSLSVLLQILFLTYSVTNIFCVNWKVNEVTQNGDEKLTLKVAKTENQRSGQQSRRIPKELMALANKNLENINKHFRCKQPRLKLMSLKQLFRTQEQYIPSCVAIHVCDDESGCCRSEDLKCVPKHQSSFDAYFLVMKAVNATTMYEAKKLTFENDTECECRSVKNQPRSYRASTEPRNKLQNADYTLCEHMRCPKPFIRRRTTQYAPFNCRCECHSNDKYCHEIKQGMQRLSDEDQRCVQIGKCHRPVCQYNFVFDERLGECVHKRHLNHYLNTRY